MNDAARTLGAQLPQDRRRALAEGRDLPARQHGAGLFADLSGFTAMTERLAERLGPLRGAEELGAWLRRIYDPLVACVEDEGGTVLGFAGDAITCFFADDDGRRAVRAAWAMQREVAALRDARAADGAPLNVRAKVVVAVGEVRRFVAGDSGRRLWDVMAGATLLRLAAMEGVAEPGDVLVDVAAARAAGFSGLTRRDDAFLLPAPAQDAGADAVGAPEVARAGAEAYRWERGEDRGDGGPWPDPDVVAPWAPAVVRERSAEGGEPIGDFRPAGALFLSFGGIDWDADPSAGERLDRFLRHVQRELDAGGGTLIQVTVGDKGAYLYAAFGAPRAHGDDAARAVRTALRLVASEGPEVGDVTGLRAGVAYGAMYTGTYGATTRATYGVLGPKTNLAARLMSRAGTGEVLCDPEAARRARRAVRFTARPAERFKGVAKPIPVHLAVRELRDDERDAGPMFGRDAERIDIGGLLAQARHGQGGYLRYQGEAGTGKSRLLAWAAEVAAGRGMRLLSGRADDGAADLGYRAWRGPVGQLLGVDPHATPRDDLGRAIGAALARIGVGSDAPDGAPELLAALLAPDAQEAHRDGVARREAIGRAVRGLFGAALAQGPALLALDDAHALDERSADLLTRVADLATTAPLALLVAHRPAGGDAAEALDAALPGPPRVLEGLETEASRMLIARVLDAPAMAVPYPVATAIHERAAGVPILIEEIVRDLQERDAVRVETRWRGIGRDARGAAPRQREVRVGFDEAAIRDLDGGLDGLLLARLDRLTSVERTAIKTAAVIGRTAEHRPLAHLLERDPAALEAALATLEAPDLLESIGEAHRFQRAGMHEAAYENLLFEQRRRLHRAMSAWHLQRLQAGETVDVERMAFHFFHATEGEDDPDLVRPALAALEALADRHLASGATEPALDALRRAERVLPDGDGWDVERARFGVRTAEALARTGRHGEARRTLGTAIEAAERAGEVGLEVEARVGRATACLRRGDVREARGDAERAHAVATRAGDAAGLALAELAVARVDAAEGAHDAALAHARAALDAWERANEDGDAGLRGRVEAGRVLLGAGALDEAESLLRRSLERAESAGRPFLEGLAGLYLGDVARARGDEAEGEERYGRATAIFDEIEARAESAHARLRAAECALAQGRLVDADRRFARVLEDALALRLAPDAVDAAVGRARVAYLRGHEGWARGIFEAARAHEAARADTLARIREVLDGAAGRPDGRGAGEAPAHLRLADARQAPEGVAARFGRGARR